jgi:peptidoglycan/LPS O-acetylase OafA/YrhL
VHQRLSPATGLRYQPEVDGLRAVAVVPVVLFHAGMGAFSGGFVGVDVFFVISGYLITGIIAADIERGRFSLRHFYERRVRRILPALFLVMLACLGAGLLLFLPDQLRSLARSELATLGFASNIWLWGQSGYFMGDARMFPLLHTWSLSLEEQFYLLFPALMVVAARVRLSRLAIVLVLLAGSFALAGVGAFVKPSASFYLLPTRAWELMLGAAIALGAVRRLGSKRVREALGWIALPLIFVPVFVYSEQTVFPGLAAVPPCLGAALLIVVGRDGGCRVTDALSARPVVAIGLISYSLYLWHWPLFVFARQVTLAGELTPLVIATCILLSFLLAGATWRWVERPFRDRRRMTRRPLLLWVSGSAVLIGGLAVAAMDGLPGRMAPETLRLAAASKSGSTLTEACNARSANAAPCRIGAALAPSFAVWGDSHAGALGEAFDLVGGQAGRGGLLYPFGGCPGLVDPSTEGVLTIDAAMCRNRSTHVIEAILADRAIRDVILVNHWQAYKADRPAFERSLDRTLQRLRRAGKAVTIVAGVPAPGYDQPWALAMANQLGVALPEAATDYRPSATMRTIAGRHGAALVDLSPALCRGQPCSLMIGNRPMFVDGNHLSREAVLTLVVPALREAGVLGQPIPPQPFTGKR